MSTQPRVLVLSAIAPLPLDRGDRNRLFYTLRALTSVASVSLCTVHREWEGVQPDYQALGFRTVVVNVSRGTLLRQALQNLLSAQPYLMCRFDSKPLRRAIQREVDEFAPDIVWAFQGLTAPFLRNVRGPARVLDLVDSPSRYVRSLRGDARFSLRQRAQAFLQPRIEQFERQAIADSDITLINSAAERLHLTKLHGSAPKIMVLPNCAPAQLLEHVWAPHSGATETRLLFVGNLHYPPNIIAARFLATQVLPRLVERGRPTELSIVGRVPQALEREFAAYRGTVVKGYVENVVEEYLAADVLLVPVPFAGGAQYKLLESMALGVPIVASPETAAASDVFTGSEFLLASTASEYADAVESIVSDPRRAREMGGAARARIASAYTWESQAGTIQLAVERAMAAR